MTRSRRIWPALVAAVALAAVAVWSTAAQGAQPKQPQRVPRGFAGMVVDEPVWPDPFIDLQQQVDTMAASGVESIRVVVDWSWAQPYRHWSDVPKGQKSRFVNVGGVPTDFSDFDQIVTPASRDQLTILPVVLNAPAWDGQRGKGGIVDVPKSDGPYAAFVKALVRRYGPRGSFWQTYPYPHPVPIRMWQIWNEPNIPAFWPFQPFESRYVGLLNAAHRAIKSVDPAAKVILAGLPNYSWINLQRIYKIRGAGNLFDVVAIHPYTKYPKGVLTILGYVRQVMNQAGDSKKPILADEISWPSSQGKTDHNVGYDFATNESGQARNIRQVLPMLMTSRKQLNLMGFYYYDWAGLERRNELAFDFSGLFRVSNGKFVAKPAYNVFRRGVLSMENCRSKGNNATSCVR